jgi:deazaflavin-dependent oxidoreductase (nitroreductase family)
MPSDFMLKTSNSLHQAITKISFGHIGWKVGKMPVVELTTIGRKTGQSRTVMLTSPITDDGAMVIVASKGGDDDNPAWFLNLQSNPEVQVAMKGAPRRPMTARVATPDERARLWPLVTAAYKGYAGYQTKTTREIPLVLLRPSSQ